MYRTVIKNASNDIETHNSVPSKAIVLILPCLFSKQTVILQDLIKKKFSIIEKRLMESSSRYITEWNSWNIIDSGTYLPIRIPPNKEIMAILVQKSGVFDELRQFVKKYCSENDDPAIYISQNSLMSFRDVSFIFQCEANSQEFLENAKEYMDLNVFPKLNRALTDLAIKRPTEPIKWLAEHLKQM